MDKKQFCDEIADKLSDLEGRLQAQSFPHPSTNEKSAQVQAQRSRVEQARADAEALRLRLEAVSTDAAPLSDALCKEIEQRLSEIRDSARV
ncbi:MAG TPA: hypothetical protein VFP91_05510 [Vicinamibacterales bacterium]|nr:hypothetical protein [Vicinamibacterales bacterium]